jgi:hypothetical protein
MLQLRQRGQGQKGTAESVRVTIFKDGILDNSTNPRSPSPCKPISHPPKKPLDQSTYTLKRAVECSILYTNKHAILYTNTPALCQPVYTTPIPLLQDAEVLGPAASSVFRNMGSIYTTDQIAHVAHKNAGSYRTAQVKANIVSAAQTRYAQVIIPRANNLC